MLGPLAVLNHRGMGDDTLNGRKGIDGHKKAGKMEAGSNKEEEMVKQPFKMFASFSALRELPKSEGRCEELKKKKKSKEKRNKRLRD